MSTAPRAKSRPSTLSDGALSKNGFLKTFFGKLGPGLVTGASDDDPSGIATYSQVGAKFGYEFLWSMLLS
ncbi:MAG TPA: hypothetical protein VGF44_03110, partial [Terriglobales bacterium]